VSTAGQGARSAVDRAQGSAASSRERRGRGEQRMVPDAQPRSYYGMPVIKQPTWTWEVPWYLYFGGMAGAAFPLSLAASLRDNRPLARSASLVALGGASISPVLLIADLGRPARFLNMLRVLKVTSPMSMGSWILTGFGPAAALGAGRELLGVLPRTGRAAQFAGVALGPLLSTYTGVLLSNTAVPVWHEARHELPFAFAGSSLLSAGGAAAMLTPATHAGPARRMAVAGVAIEGAAMQLMQRRLKGLVGEPYRAGAAHRLERASQAATTLGGITMALAGRRRSAAVTAGALLLAGSALLRWSVFKAGFASARDPRYTVEPQRERLAARRAGA
jgi:formate-dependent nitrite reductase membrane component NrfD